MKKIIIVAILTIFLSSFVFGKTITTMTYGDNVNTYDQTGNKLFRGSVTYLRNNQGVWFYDKNNDGKIDSEDTSMSDSFNKAAEASRPKVDTAGLGVNAVTEKQVSTPKTNSGLKLGENIKFEITTNTLNTGEKDNTKTYTKVTINNIDYYVSNEDIESGKLKDGAVLYTNTAETSENPNLERAGKVDEQNVEGKEGKQTIVKLSDCDGKPCYIDVEGKKGTVISRTDVKTTWDILIKGTAWITNFMDKWLPQSSYMSLLYDESDEKYLLGNKDSSFYRDFLGGKQSWISDICEARVTDSDELNVLVPGMNLDTLASQSVWMAAEKVPYSIPGEGAGAIYKISSELNKGNCKLKYLLFIDDKPLIKEDISGEAYTYDSSSSLLGGDMVIFFSKQNYNEVCIKFTELSTGCFVGITKGDKTCWPIQNAHFTIVNEQGNPIDNKDEICKTGCSSSGDATSSGSGEEQKASPVVNPDL